MSQRPMLAWGLVVPDEDYVGRALSAVSQLRKLGTRKMVICFFGRSTSSESRTTLNAVCDYVIYLKYFRKLGDGLDVLDEFLMNALESGALVFLKKITFIHPNVLIFKQPDSAFDHKGILFDIAGKWSMVCVDVTSLLSGNSFNSFHEFCTIQGHWGGGGQLKSIPRVSDMSTFVPASSSTMASSLQNELTLVKLNDELTRKHNILNPGGLWNKVFLQEGKQYLTNGPPAITHRESRNWIAVVGMSCRFPQADSLEEYWAIFEQGKNTASAPPRERNSLSLLEPSSTANWLGCRVDEFDAEFFGVAPSEAEVMDPQSRLTLEVSWEALEDAGIMPETLRGSPTGVFYGSWLQDYKEIMNLESPSSDNLRKYMSNGFGCSAAKLSFFYGLGGPNIATESGCSSSMVAVDLAVKSLLMGECSLALATGSNLILQWRENKNIFWAEDGISKTFDAAVDGYGRAEGVGVLILKRYSDAVVDHDRVYGVICGSGVCQEGESPSFGSPTVKSEASCMKACLNFVDMDPSEIDFIEAHGTGTAVGDPVEAAAIVGAYACAGEARPSPLYIASGKTNIGHTESCSGIAGIIKVLLSLEHETIPRHLNVTELNSKLNFEKIGARIPFQSVPWPRNPARPRYAAVSSFGITGTDVHMMLREAPVQVPPPDLPSVSMQVPHILCLTARTSTALDELTQSYLSHLENQNEDFKIMDMAYTANACRSAHALRRLITGKSKGELQTNIRNREWVDCDSKAGQRPIGVCFTFPGTIGKVDMTGAKGLYSSFPVFKMNMDKCDALFNTTTKLSLLPALDELNKVGPMECIAAVMAVQYSLAQLWSSWGVRPSWVMGHCHGEIVAAVAVGALTLEDAFKIVSSFQRFIELSAAQPGEMLAVGADGPTVEELIEKYYFLEAETTDQHLLEVAALNSKTQTVVTGPPHLIQTFGAFCLEREVKCRRVPVDFPFHSRRIESALKECGREFIPETFSPPVIPYISSVTGGILRDADVTKDYWLRCFRNKVQFTAACATASTVGADVFLEIGLGSSLTKLTSENLAGSGICPECTPSFRRNGGVVGVLASLVGLGVDIDWAAYYQYHPVSKVRLPHYPFQRKPYWFKRKGHSHNGKTALCETPPLVHPLLGGQVSLAVRQPHVTFEVCLSASPAMEYIQDHMIGDEVVFPAAGYVEMMLAAGIHGASLDGRSRPSRTSIQHFSISAPLLVNSSPDSTNNKMQTTIELESTTMADESRKVSVYSERGANDWRLHACGTVTSSWLKPSSEAYDETRLDLQKIMQRVPLDSKGGPNFYQELASLGFNFGEKFRSMLTFRRNESEVLAEVKCPTREADDDHLLHPILIDSMIHAFFFGKWLELSGRLHVPMSIQKFEFLHAARPPTGGCQGEEERFYVYCKRHGENSSESRIALTDHHGNIVAVMENPGLAATYVDAVLEAGRGAKTVSTLNTYEVCWERAHHQIPVGSYNSSLCGTLPPTISAILEGRGRRRQLTVEEEILEENINRLCALYVLNMLYELGWEAEAGRQWLLADLIAEFRVKEPLARAFSRYLDFLVEEGLMMKRTDEERQCLTLTSPAPPWETVKEEILKSLGLLQDYPALKVISACGSNLRAALQGELSGQFILFGKGEGGDDGGEDSLAETYYVTNRFRQEERGTIRDVFEELCVELLREPGRRDRSEPIRILEVGAGTGSFTRVVMKSLADSGIPFQYHFTDISPAFFEGAKERFKDHEAHVAYKTLDIEKDPLAQGFPPHHFDIVVGVDVFHATAFLQQTIRHVGLLTRFGGSLLIGETECPIREIDIIFGLLSGYWTFQDTHLRQHHCLVSSECWEQLMSQCGFRGAGHLLTGVNQKSVIVGKLNDLSAWDNSNQQTHSRWLAIGEHFPADFDWLVERMKGLGRELTVWDHPHRSCESVEGNLSQLSGKMGGKRFEGILCFVGGQGPSSKWQDRRNLLRDMVATFKYIGQGAVSPLPRLHLVTTGTWASGHEGDFSVLDPSGGALWGLARSARAEISELTSKSVDLDPAGGSVENMERVLMELWLDDTEPEVLHRQGLRYVRRLRVEQRKQTTNLEFPLSSRFEICLPSSRAISDLRFVPKKDVGAAGLSGELVEVEIKSTSLNFRDVLIVMKPAGSVFESISVLGFDYAGVVTQVGPSVQRLQVGQRVYGISTGESTLSSHIVTEESYGIRIPPGLTFAEAATFPAVFLTVWYSMVEVAQVKPGQTVLVHAVTGGVGLVAIQLGKILGVEVIGTAGSPRKRNFARSLGLKHVFNSRDLTFRDQVRHATGGAGVDMVLNCLTGPGFKEASLELCKDDAHFVEISKLDVWSEEEVQGLRPQVHYKLVWLPDVQPELISSMMVKMNELVELGASRPLHMTRFQASQLPAALSTLQRAKHIGKVIVDLPSFHPEQNRFAEKLFSKDRSYLITGGMGAIGLTVAKWMVSQGASTVILAGRSEPNQVALEAISQLRDEFKATIVCKQMDISSYDECKVLLKNLFPPLGGVHHCAGVLGDKMLVNLNWGEFESVIKPKIDGLYNLHQLTAHLPLEFFVAYSSIASTMGNLGQSNYAAGNAFMESLIGARVAAGLKGLVVSWGQWKAGLAEHVKVKAATPFSLQEGILALERFFLESKTSIVAGHFQFPEMIKNFPAYSRTFLKEMASSGDEERKAGFGKRAEGKGEAFLLQFHKKRDGVSEEETDELITTFVRETVCSILGIAVNEFEDDCKFTNIGMDSLMSIDFTNKLQSELPGVALGYIDMAEFGTVNKMSSFIGSLIK